MAVATRTVDFIAPARHCASCGAVAPCIRATSERFEGIPGGTEYEYSCSACGKTFIVESWGRLVFSAVAAAALGALGWALATGTLERQTMPTWTGWALLMFAGGVTVHGVYKARLRWRCPVVKG